MTAHVARSGRTPVALWLPATAAVAFLVLPLAGLLGRAPWRDLGTHLSDPRVTEALWLSVVCSFGSLAVAVVLGVPLAWLLARREFRGRSLVRALVTLPLVLPPVVGGVALLLAFGRSGVLGPGLDEVGVRLPFTTAGAVVAGAFVAMPFLVLAVEGALAGSDRRLEAAAATLGASRFTVFRRITLPLVAPNSPSARAQASAAPAARPGATSGTVTVRNTRHGDDPSVAATSS